MISREGSMEPIVFRRWSNKRYAILSSFHKVIRIGTLSLCYSLLQQQPVLAQADSLAPRIFLELEEVESISSQEAELYSPLLRQLMILRQEQLEFSSSRSLPDILNYLPGVDIRTRGIHGMQSDLSIQGGSFDQSLVLLNGVNVSNPQTGHFNMDLPLAPSFIHQVEVLKGPAARKYGLNAYTGAINIVTQPKDSVSLQAELAYGSWNTINAGAAAHIPLGSTKTMLTFSTLSSDGYSDNTDFSSQQLFLHSDWDTKSVEAELMLGWNQKSFGANAFYTPRFPEQYEETAGLLSILKLQSKGKRNRYSANLHWKRHQDHFLLFRSNPSAYENFHLSDVAGAKLGTRISSKLGISTLSLEYRYEQIYSTTLGEALPVSRPVSGAPGIFFDSFSARNHFSLVADQLLKQDRWYINAGLLIHAGIDALSLPGIYPGLDLAYRLQKGFSLFASVNRSMRLPTFTDLYYQGPQNRGNPNLKPEKALTFEGGARFTHDWLHAEIAAFYRAGKETIDWVWEDSLWQTKNFTDLNTYGLEATITLKPESLLSGSKLIDYLSIGYSNTEISKGKEDVISNYVLDYLKHKVLIDMKLDLGSHFFVDLKFLWQDRAGSFLFYATPEAEPLDTPYDPFWLLDINAGFKYRRISVFIDGQNLLNAAYRDIGSVLMPGRAFMLGIRYR